MRCHFSICSSTIAQRKETKHYLKIEDTHTLIKERKSVYMWVCPWVCDYFIIHGNLKGRWRPNTHTHRPPSAMAPQMPYGVVIIHGVSQLPAGPDKLNYTAEMGWLHTRVYTCCVLVYLWVCISEPLCQSVRKTNSCCTPWPTAHTTPMSASACVGVNMLCSRRPTPWHY